jgi:hypothetical protein
MRKSNLKSGAIDLGARGIRARICQLFKEPSNRFSAWRNRFLGSLNVYKYGLRSRSRVAKMAKIKKKIKNFMFRFQNVLFMGLAASLGA